MDVPDADPAAGGVDRRRALRRPSEFVRLVEAIREGLLDEAHWLEWKATLDLKSKHGAFTVARAILGFANRDPVRAARDCEGCAYLVVGAEPGDAAGVAVLDPAVLEQAVAPYVGGHNGPAWAPTYTTIDHSRVLVVTVEAPRLGHRAWPLRKTFQGESGDGANDGVIFVRHLGKTERASSADMDMLAARATGSTAASGFPAEVTIGWVNEPPTVPRLNTNAGREGWIATERERLMNGIPDREPSMGATRTTGTPSPLASQALVQQLAATSFRAKDRRGVQGFRGEAEIYLTKCAHRWDRVVLSRYAELDVGALGMRITNPSDRNLPAVEVRILFPHTIRALPGDEGIDMPDPPKAWGTDTFENIALLNIGRSFLPKTPVLATARPWFTVDEDGHCVTFRAFDLRPQQTEPLEPVTIAVAPDHNEGPVNASWSLTSTAFDGVHTGTLTFNVAGDIYGHDLIPVEEEDDQFEDEYDDA